MHQKYSLIHKLQNILNFSIFSKRTAYSTALLLLTHNRVATSRRGAPLDYYDRMHKKLFDPLRAKISCVFLF